MNRKAWKKQGKHVFIRNFRGCLFAFVFDAKTEEIHGTEVHNGHWMEHNDLTQSPWSDLSGQLSPECMHNFRRSAEWCYCGHCGIDCCDFCATVRHPDGAPWPIGWYVETT